VILTDILEEHLEETDFLWSHRQSALADRASTLHRLAELEERLLAHLDGLVLSEDAGWQFLSPKLTEGSVGEAFAAAWVALASEHSRYLDALLAALNTANGPVLQGFRQAFCHAPGQHIVPLLTSMLSENVPTQRAMALDALSFRRSAIPDRQLKDALRDKEPQGATAALTAVGRLKKKTLLSSVEALLEAEQPNVRHEAMRAGLLVGSIKALSCCRAAVQGKAEEGNDALTFLGLVGQVDHARLLSEALYQPQIARHAVSALKWLGYSSEIERLIPLAGNQKLAQLVGETVSRITGVDLVAEGLVLSNPPIAGVPQRAGGEDEYLDDPDEGLPWPDSAKLSAWWKANASRFNTGTRYRNGRPHTREMLINTLQHGNLADRHQAAFELAILDPIGPLIETSAFSDRQQCVCANLKL
jgi:uncharacterized protein (TIGR02270 family)